MSQAAPSSDPGDPRRSGQRPTEAGRRRSRALVLGLIAAVIVGIFAVLLLITQCGSNADDVSQGQDTRPAADVVLDAGAPLAA